MILGGFRRRIIRIVWVVRIVWMVRVVWMIRIVWMIRVFRVVWFVAWWLGRRLRKRQRFSTFTSTFITTGRPAVFGAFPGSSSGPDGLVDGMMPGICGGRGDRSSNIRIFWVLSGLVLRCDHTTTSRNNHGRPVWHKSADLSRRRPMRWSDAGRGLASRATMAWGWTGVA